MSVVAPMGIAMIALLAPATQTLPAASVATFALVAARPLPARSDFAKAAMVEMITATEDARSGNSPDPEVGRYVIVLVKLSSNDARAIQKGRLDAMKRIGEYLGANIESSTESGYREKTGADGTSASSSFFKDYSAVRVNQTLGAVDMIGLATRDGRTLAGFILSEGAARRMQTISEESAAAMKAKKGGQPLEVKATGISPIEGGDQAAAQKAALDSAKRTALEMAMGASVIGLSAMDRDDSSEAFRDTCFSTTEGVIEGYEVLSEGAEGNSYVVRIRATIQQGKLLDSYRSHLRSMGDPVFCVDASADRDLQAAANRFFEDRGFRIKEGGDCDWTIQLTPTFTERADPRNTTRTGTQCNISAKLVNRRTGEITANAGVTGKWLDSSDGGPAEQRRNAAQIAFRNMSRELHERIDASILRLAREGRPITVEIRGLAGVDGATTRLTDALAIRPGINDAKVNLRPDGTIVVELKSVLASDLVGRFVGADACNLAKAAGSRPVIERQEDHAIALRIVEGKS